MYVAAAKPLIRFSYAAGHCLREVFAFLGVGALYFAVLVGAAMFAGMVDSPHPRYAPETSWAELRFAESLEIVGLLTIAVFVAMALSVAMDKVRGCRVDLRFYPVPRRIRAILRSALPRTVLAAGLLAVVGYLVTTLTAPWLVGRPPYGSFWPAERVLLSLVLTWNTIWLAETVVRPIRTPMLAAIIFSVVSLLIGFIPVMRPSVALQRADRTAMEIRSVSDLIYALGWEIEARRIGLDRVPSWATETTETEHFIYHHAKGDVPFHDSLEAQERHYRFFKNVFHITLPQKIHYVKYPYPNNGEIREGPLASRAGALGGKGWIHARRWFNAHEAVHCYLRSRNMFLYEGIAEAFGSSFSFLWGDERRDPLEMSIQNLRAGMNRLLGSSISNVDRGVGQNFTWWLFYRHGPEKLVAALREAYVESGRTRDVFARVYGVPFNDLAGEWQHDQKWLSERPPFEGFFTYAPWDREVRAPVSAPAAREP